VTVDEYAVPVEHFRVDRIVSFWIKNVIRY
jgi:hypothetical protein